MMKKKGGLCILSLCYENRTLIIVFSVMIVCMAALVVVLYRSRKDRLQAKQQLLMEQERKKKDAEYREQLEYIANYDDLTGLYNKHGFIERTKTLMLENPDVVYSIFQININGFKIVNEVYGFQRGDRVLIQLAEQLQKEIGEKGVCCRVHTDNYIVCYPLSSETGRNLLKRNTRVMECNGQQITIHLRVGVYTNTDKISDIQLMMDYAQIALQSGSQTSKDGFAFYEDKYLQTMLRNEEITSSMEKALREEQFQVYYQPQYNISDDTLVGAEALVRWNHPQKGLISPAEFIPVFEQNGFIYQLDCFICEKVCEAQKQWRKSGKYLPVSINLSRVDLQEPGLLTMLLNCLRKYDLPKDCLHLEVTESAYVEDDGTFNQNIKNLRESGFILEMDDFGSGYSSFNMLKDVSVDILKLDMGFFNKESNMEKGGEVITSLVELAHSIGLLVIAEGVETDREANFLRSIHCNLVQGYFYGKPMPEASFTELLQHRVLGNKMQLSDSQQTCSKRGGYWTLEERNFLVSHFNCILMEYEPGIDKAVLILKDADGNLKHMEHENEKNEMAFHKYLYPDDQELLLKKLRETDQEWKEFDYRADYDESGIYRLYHATMRMCPSRFRGQ